MAKTFAPGTLGGLDSEAMLVKISASTTNSEANLDGSDRPHGRSRPVRFSAYNSGMMRLNVSPLISGERNGPDCLGALGPFCAA
jgi:hypothetical protein